MKNISKHLLFVAISVICFSKSTLGTEAADASTMHAHHQMMMETKTQLVNYKIPQIQLVREDGKLVSLIDELNDGRPLILNFIYTTCTTICPLTSQTFFELQNKLGGQRDSVHMVSISIDPEQDTPEVLTKYALKFGAGSQWQFYTGTLESSIAAQRAFDVYRGSKMKHSPVTFIRAAQGKSWLRIDGFAKVDEIIHSLEVLGNAENVPLSGSGKLETDATRPPLTY